MISIDESDGSISLHRIELSGGHLSLVQLADLSRGICHEEEVVWSKMLPAMAPHPIFSYARENRLVVGAPTGTSQISPFFILTYLWRSSVYLFGITLDGGVNFEMEFQIPNPSELFWISGQGRIVGFLFQTVGSESAVVTVIHLDYPGVTLEIQLPPYCGHLNEDFPPYSIDTPQAFVESWKVCFPTPHLAVIYDRNHILAYTLPQFATLPHGKQRLDEGPTWRLSNIIEDHTGICRPGTFAEVFYDPSPPDDRFNIHLLHQLDDSNYQAYAGLLTLTIDPSVPPSPSGAPTYQRIVSRFPIEGLMATGSLHPETYHSRTRLHSEGLDVWVSSLEDMSSAQANGEGEGRGSLYMFVSNEELEPDLEWEGVDLDEASGRVFIWGPAFRWMTPCETRIFVGELVS